MIHRRKIYKVIPGKLDDFNEFFHTYLYPNQVKNGAKLIGRWVTDTQDEILAIWEYKSLEHYEEIEDRIKKSELYQKAKQRKLELGKLFVESSQDFLVPTTQPDTFH